MIFKKYLLKFNNKLYDKWLYLLLFINIIWVQFVTPLRMSFEDKRTVYGPIAFGDLVIDIIYIIDSILTFFVPDTTTNVDGNIKILTN